MASRLSTINSTIASLTRPHAYSCSDNSTVDDNMYMDDLFVELEDMYSMPSPGITSTMQLAGQRDLLWPDCYAAYLDQELPFLELSPNPSSALHEQMDDDDQILEMPWDGNQDSSSDSCLWPVDQWSPPSCTTNCSSYESCSFTASPLHSVDTSQHSDVTDQNSLSCGLNADQYHLYSLPGSSSTTTESYHHTAITSHVAVPDPKRQNSVVRMPSTCNDVIAMAEGVAASSSGDLAHEFWIECENLAIEDGYTWRKYGEKSIMGRAYRRAYFRCAHNGCIVKKQAERSSNKEGFVVINYFGKHNHHPTYQ